MKHATSAHAALLARLALALALALLLAACDQPPAGPPDVPALPTATVATITLTSTVIAGTEVVTGTVEPLLSARIEAKISGRITRLPVSLGQQVTRGSVLVEIAADEIAARLAQAEVGRRQAAVDYERAEQLLQAHAMTRAEFDAADNRLRGARAAVAEASALSRYMRIEAPFDGIVAAKLADEGDLAAPGKALLLLEGRTGLRFVADLPASLATRVSTDSKVAIAIDGLDATLRGRVTEVAPAADPRTRTVRIKVSLPDTGGLMSGQFGRLSMPAAQRDALLVPASALVVRGQLEMVFVAVDGRAQMRLVRTGRQHDGLVEILSGLAPGLTIVTDGAASLSDGQPLAPR